MGKWRKRTRETTSIRKENNLDGPCSSTDATTTGMILEAFEAIILVTTLSSRGRALTSSENHTNHSCFYNVA